MRLPRLFVGSLVLTVALAACGDAEQSSSSSAPVPTAAAATTTAAPVATTSPAGPTTTNAAKPTVSIPATLPTKLVITDLKAGSGDAARVGDTVVVNYIGVRSADGTEFDNSYDKGQPFSVTLGKGEVIKGWDQGLVGIKQGGRRQLDIPAALAYGDTPQGNVIKAGDALSFVIDAVAVLPAVDPATAPTVSIPGGANVTTLGIKDLKAGTGAEIKQGQTAVVNLLAFRADTGAQLASTWETGQLQPIPYTDGGSLPGLIQGLAGMKIGGLRQITIPYALAFGDAGNTNFGLPAKTDMVLVIELVTAY
jgi:FKBP-type peptidyl-prolyl cis-trans isomerase